MNDTVMCRMCSANPPAIAGRCLPCHVDTQAETRAQEMAAEQARITQAEALRQWRPPWKPGRNVPRGHGTGTPREALARGSR